MLEFGRIYERLGIRFDTIIPESFFEDKMGDILEDLQKKNLVKESEGALLVFFPDPPAGGIHLPPLMVVKGDGATLYATRELATDKYRKETYKPDLIINEVGSEQSLYFKQIFELEEMLSYFKKSKRVHVAHGLYRFKEGKMSTRKGNAIRLLDLINEGVRRAAEINKEIAETVAIGAIKFNDLKRECVKEIVFNWEEVLNLKGDSGPYLQYTYVRACSVLENAKMHNIEKLKNWKLIRNWKLEIGNLERLLYRFPEVVIKSTSEYAPHHIATYLVDLARSFNAYYGEKKIVDPANKVSEYRLALTEAVAIVLKNGLGLLGIKLPEKM
jgi:arginyl-tRNA synthetase